MRHPSVRFAALLMLSCALCLAQTTQVGQKFQAIAVEVQAASKWVAITIMAVAGLGAAFGGTNVLRHFSGTFGGIIIALFATSLVLWLAI